MSIKILGRGSVRDASMKFSKSKAIARSSFFSGEVPAFSTSNKSISLKTSNSGGKYFISSRRPTIPFTVRQAFPFWEGQYRAGNPPSMALGSATLSFDVVAIQINYSGSNAIVQAAIARFRSTVAALTLVEPLSPEKSNPFSCPPNSTDPTHYSRLFFFSSCTK